LEDFQYKKITCKIPKVTLLDHLLYLQFQSSS
jgi:hypothetical protein